MPETTVTPAAVTVSTQQRWRTCLHEAGHVVTGVVLLKKTSRAAVFADGGGVTGLSGSGDVPQSDEEALAVAAGPAAAMLVYDHQPPQVEQRATIEDRQPELASRLKVERDTNLSDDEAIARWCIAGYEWNPYRWKHRFDWLDEQAGAFVDAHKQEILEVATALFRCGAITLPVEPAEKGTENG